MSHIASPCLKLYESGAWQGRRVEREILFVSTSSRRIFKERNVQEVVLN